MSSEQLHGTRVPPQRGPFPPASWVSPSGQLGDPRATSTSRRWTRSIGKPVAFLVVFLLGVMVGVSDTSAERERDQAREQLAAAESQVLTLRERADEAASLGQLLAAAEADVTRLEGEAAAAASASARLTAELQATQAEVGRLNGDVSRLQGEVVAAQARSAPAPSSPRTSGSVTSALAPISGSSSASYANCSEARAAGAAPLYRSDPGYAPGLDRDDDGVACE